MSEDIDVEKLARVLNSTSQHGKSGFVRTLWNNQSTDIQIQLMPLLNAETQQAIKHPSDDPEQPGDT